MYNNDLINYEDGLKRLGTSAFYAKMLEKFKNDINLNEIDAALASGDMEKAQVAVHTLKGLAGNLSLTELFNSSMELEKQVKVRDINPEQITILKDAFAKTLAEVEKVLKQDE